VAPLQDHIQRGGPFFHRSVGNLSHWYFPAEKFVGIEILHLLSLPGRQPGIENIHEFGEMFLGYFGNFSALAEIAKNEFEFRLKLSSGLFGPANFLPGL
jgi:hypothetical protein